MQKTTIQIDSLKITVAFSFPYPEETWYIASVRDAQGRFASIAPFTQGVNQDRVYEAFAESFEQTP
jgi:hypothetical protein